MSGPFDWRSVIQPHPDIVSIASAPDRAWQRLRLAIRERERNPSADAAAAVERFALKFAKSFDLEGSGNGPDKAA